jgi:hypothetical protein
MNSNFSSTTVTYAPKVLRSFDSCFDPQLAVDTFDVHLPIETRLLLHIPSHHYLCIDPPWQLALGSMDPPSITTSIIGILQLSSKMIGYLNDVKDAPKERAKCVIELANIYSRIMGG